jgi:hypothetical protein
MFLKEGHFIISSWLGDSHNWKFLYLFKRSKYSEHSRSILLSRAFLVCSLPSKISLIFFCDLSKNKKTFPSAGVANIQFSFLSSEINKSGKIFQS